MLRKTFFTGVNVHDIEDPFPGLFVQPILDENTSSLLKPCESLLLDFLSSVGKKLY